MARVKIAQAEDLSGSDREFYERSMAYGSFGSLVGAMANRPPILRNIFGLLTELKAEGVLPPRYQELALVAVSKLNECTYCVSHHTPYLSAAGVSEGAAANILDYENQAEFDAVDRLVIEYAMQVTTQPNQVRDGIFERLREHFSNEQIVELTWRTSLCGAFNRFNDVLQLDIEEGVEVVELDGSANAA